MQYRTKNEAERRWQLLFWRQSDNLPMINLIELLSGLSSKTIAANGAFLPIFRSGIANYGIFFYFWMLTLMQLSKLHIDIHSPHYFIKIFVLSVISIIAILSIVQHPQFLKPNIICNFFLVIRFFKIRAYNHAPFICNSP